MIYPYTIFSCIPILSLSAGGAVTMADVMELQQLLNVSMASR